MRQGILQRSCSTEVREILVVERGRQTGRFQRSGDRDPGPPLGAEELAGLLREQAKELKAYWETSNKEHAAKYHKIREKVWAGITEVLKAE